MSVHKVIIYANDYILRVKEITTMNEITSTNRWGSRIRLCLITLLGLSIFFKIGNLILPPVIDINFEDIVTVIIYWIMLLFIYTLFGLFLAPIPTLVMIVLVICILIWFIKGIKPKQEDQIQGIDLVKSDSEVLEKDEQKESIDLVEAESEALEKEGQSQAIDARQS